MTLPSLIQKLIEEILENLDPYKSYCDLLKFYHDHIQIKDFQLPVKNDLYVFGVGKSSSFEVKAIVDLINQTELSNSLKGVYALTKRGHGVKDDFKQWEGDHPLVSKLNIENSKEFIFELENVKPNDSVIFLISGGTSSLLEIPRVGLSFEELQRKHEALLNSGLNINEMNRQRKLLSQVKAGGLLKSISTNNIVQLITCDIPNENLSDVGSGPLISEDRNIFSLKVQSASILLEKLCTQANRVNLGVFDGQIDELAKELLKMNFEKGKYYIGGGEATVTIEHFDGLGGRNTHFVLLMAQQLYKNPDLRDLKICSIGTDGSDGPTDAAGAYIDYTLFQTLDCDDYLEAFDSYNYFKKLGTLIKTGPTKTNVMDIRMIWRE